MDDKLFKKMLIAIGVIFIVALLAVVLAYIFKQPVPVEESPVDLSDVKDATDVFKTH